MGRIGQENGKVSVFSATIHPRSDEFQALDIPSLVRTGRIVYVDGLNLASAAISTTDAQRLPTTKVKSHRLNDIRGAINLALASQSLTTPPSPPSSVNMSEKGAKPVVIIDGVDFVLASQPEVDRLNLQQFLFHVRLRAHALILSCNADAPLLHHHDDSATPLEREHSAFLTTMAHQSSYVMQLRDLETGTAKDITGVLRISSGGSDLYEGPQGPAEKLHNGEWLYQVRGDGQVRVWTRGE